MRNRGALVAFLLAASARALSAQSAVSIAPANGSFPEGYEIDVTITFCLTTQLYYYDHLIQFNGVDVTANFSWNPGVYAGCDYYATATGSVTPAYAQNSIYARIRTWDLADTFVENDNNSYFTGTDPLAPHNGHNRNMAMCAFSCFHNVVSYSTPAYWSLDTPRSVTLRYSSGQLGDLHTVNVDVHNRQQNMPSWVLLRVQNASGAYVPFTNGTTYMYYSAVAGTHRLAAQLDTTLASGAHRFTLVVTRQFGGGPAAMSYPMRILSVNELDSPYGAGWTIAGLPRIRTGPGDSLSVTDGFGSIAFWKRQSCSGSNPETCIYTPPPGAFDSLTRCSGSLCSGNLSYGIRYIDGSRVNFDGSGRPVALMDAALGNVTSVHWRDASRVDSIVDPAGKKITLHYDGSTLRLDSIVDTGLRRTRFIINASNDLTHILDAAGDTTLEAASYDASHRLRYRRDRRGGDWRTGYDFAGYVARDSTPEIRIDSAGSGYTVRLVSLYRSPESAILIDSSSSAGRTTGNLATPEPDSAGIARVTPSGSAEQIVRVDRYGLPLAVLAPAQSIALYTRNEHGQLLTSWDSLGSRSFSWDGPRNTLIVTNVGATQTTVTQTWNATYHRVTDVYGNGVAQRRQFVYGTGGRLDSTRVFGEPWSKFYYDSQGRDTLSVDPWGHATRTRYQASGLKNSDSVSTGPRWALMTRDAIGRVARTTGPLSRRDTTAYDALNLVTFQASALNDSIRFWRGSDLGIDSLRDALLNKYHFRRNAIGWDTATIDPRGSVEWMGYSRAGRVVRTVNRRGQTNAFSYNTFGQLLGRGPSGGALTEFTYTAARTTASTPTEGSDTVRMAGDTLYSIAVRAGHVFSVRSHYTASTRTRRVAVKTSAAGGWEETVYTADSLGRLRTITPPSASTDSLFYSTEGGLARTWLHGAETIRQSHRPRHVLARDSFAVSAMHAAFGREYIHDAYGRVIEARDSNRSRIEEFTYDAGGRLTAWTRRLTSSACTATDTTSETGTACTTGSSSIVSQSFSYDALGNRTDLGGSLVANGGNRLEDWNGYNFEYDATGNLTRRYKTGVLDHTYVWNSFNELTSVSVTGGSVIASFGYDAWGRRVRKSVGADTTWYVWDGSQVIAEFNDAGVMQRQFTYYGGDRPHSVLSGGSRHYFASDGRANVIGLMNSSASTVEARYRYTPFGDTAATSATVTNQVRFAGRELDTETGLYYNRARYYDPQVGRFISEDPIGLAGGANPYVFAGNDPVNGRDPSGNKCEWREVAVNASLREASAGGETTSELYCDDLGWQGHGVGTDWRGGGFEGSPWWNSPGAVAHRGSQTGSGLPDSPCLRGGFNAGQCFQIARALETLIEHQVERCQTLGASAANRFQAGRFRYDPNTDSYGYVRLPFGRTIFLGSRAFLPSELANTIAHEEYHLANRITSMHIWSSKAYDIGNECDGAI